MFKFNWLNDKSNYKTLSFVSMTDLVYIIDLYGGVIFSIHSTIFNKFKCNCENKQLIKLLIDKHFMCVYIYVRNESENDNINHCL